MDRSEALDRYGQDLLFRYGLAELDAEGYELNDVFADANRHIKTLLGDIRAYVPPKDRSEGETGQAQNVHDPDSSGQSKKNGYHTRPHVIQGNRQLNDLVKYHEIKDERDDLLQRYYPPMTKLSLGSKSPTNPSADAEARALSFITLLTANKPSRYVQATRMAFLPELSFDDLVRFVEVFKQMPSPGLRWTATENGVYLHHRSGNYENSTDQEALAGHLSLLPALHEWQKQASREIKLSGLIKKLASARMFVISSDSGDVFPEMLPAVPHFGDSAAVLKALNFRSIGRLREQLSPAEQASAFRSLREWLYRWDGDSFWRFLAAPATYPSAFASLIDFYFDDMDDDLIRSAKAVGRHVNAQCWHAASGSSKAQKRENKAKNLASIESQIDDAHSGTELISRLTVQIGRLTGSDFPVEADRFFDAVIGGDLPVEKAKQMLVAYSRLRQNDTSSEESSPSSDSDELDFSHL